MLCYTEPEPGPGPGPDPILFVYDSIQNLERAIPTADCYILAGFCSMSTVYLI